MKVTCRRVWMVFCTAIRKPSGSKYAVSAWCQSVCASASRRSMAASGQACSVAGCSWIIWTDFCGDSLPHGCSLPDRRSISQFITIGVAVLHPQSGPRCARPSVPLPTPNAAVSWHQNSTLPSARGLFPSCPELEALHHPAPSSADPWSGPGPDAINP